MSKIYRENKKLILKNQKESDFDIRDGGRLKPTFCSLFINII